MEQALRLPVLLISLVPLALLKSAASADHSPTSRTMFDGFIELIRVLGVVSLVERTRLTVGPARQLSLLRERGQVCRQRTIAERARLRRLIGVVDRLMTGGANCYRRALLEVALDQDAAGEPLRLGLRRRGGLRSGHAWLPSAAGTAETYDAEFVV